MSTADGCRCAFSRRIVHTPPPLGIASYTNGSPRHVRHSHLRPSARHTRKIRKIFRAYLRPSRVAPDTAAVRVPADLRGAKLLGLRAPCSARPPIRLWPSRPHQTAEEPRHGNAHHTVFETTRGGRLVALLRRGGLTIDEMATELRITPAAVRAQISAMQRDGLVRRGGQRRGTTRPSHVYEITQDVDQLLSRAYIPLMTHVLQAVTAKLSRRQVGSVMRHAGKALACELMRGKRPFGTVGAGFGSKCADERRARCPHARQMTMAHLESSERDVRCGLHGKAPCRVHRDGISAAGGGRRAGDRVL